MTKNNQFKLKIQTIEYKLSNYNFKILDAIVKI